MSVSNQIGSRTLLTIFCLMSVASNSAKPDEPATQPSLSTFIPAKPAPASGKSADNTAATGNHVVLPPVDSGDVGRVFLPDTTTLTPVPESSVVTINPFADRVTYQPEIAEPETESFGTELAEHLLLLLEKPIHPLARATASSLRIHHDETETGLHHHAVPLQEVPHRPELIFEAGEAFLAPGWLKQGIATHTGAIWRPALWVFGTYRTGVNYFDNKAGTNVTEWANRLDLFGQVNLSGTERLLVGIRPFDEEQGSRRTFTGYDFRNGQTIDGWNVDVQTLFFEGDFGEIFPRLDPFDTAALDYGFSVGRQPMSFQQGLLINEDLIDAVTVTRNTLSGNGILNLRATGVYAWNSITRNNNQQDHNAQLVGLFTETDTAFSTINADVSYVHSDSSFGSLLNFAISGIQRFHGVHNTYNSSVHFLASIPTDGETAASGQGELLFSQFSWTPHHSNDLVYLNTFWAIDQFTSAARGPLAGGPLGQTGVLFSAAGVGRYGAALSNQASDAIGASLGYQVFFCDTKRQVTFEIAGRQDTNGLNDAAAAGGLRYQQAFDQHWLMVVDTFLAKRESRDLSPGARIEFQMKF